MQESKIDATDRLRREGRWEEASAYRDEVRKRLRAEGKPKAEAVDASWEAMVEKYPPLEPDEPESTLDPTGVEFGSEPTTPLKESEWVAEALGQLALGEAIEQCLSAKSWGMLVWAKKSPDKFYSQREQMLRREKDAQKTPDKIRRDARKQIDVVQRMRDRLAKLPSTVQAGQDAYRRANAGPNLP